MSTVLIAGTSDIHAGSMVAVCPPVVQYDDGGEYHASKAQSWLYQNWLTYWEEVERQRDEEQAELYQVFNGDVTEGDHHKTTQILSGNSAVQSRVVSKLFETPLALAPDKLFFVRGTEAHVGASGSSEEKIAENLRMGGKPIVGDPPTGAASHWHLEMVVQEQRIEFAHHGRNGQRPWTEKNIQNLLAFQIFSEHHLRGELHPHLAVRAHMHRVGDTHDNFPTRLVQMPAWQLHTAYTRKAVPESLSHIGGIIVKIKDGALSVQKLIYEPGPGFVWRA